MVKMKKWKLSIRKEVRVAFALLGVCALIGFSERKQIRVTCKSVTVEINNDHENYFMDEAQVMNLLNSTYPMMVGADVNGLNFREIEVKLMTDSHIEDAQLFADLKGNIVVRTELRRPIARIVRNVGPDAYIAADGTIMPVSDKYTSRVMLVSGGFGEQVFASANMSDVEQGQDILAMIRFISEDEFWKAQVAQLDIDRDGDIRILPQVTGQVVEFGKATDIETKFSKLMIFYKEILPQRGWTKYDRVNLKYEGQIIAD
jgi:cell division protein FtsQ